MAENNVTWKDGAGFSEECTKVIESFFERYEPVILLSRSRQEPWRFQAYDHEELIKSLTEDNPTEDLRNAIMLDTFHRSPGILPYLMELRDRLIRLEGCANKVLECSDSRDKFANECIKSTHNLLETVDDQIDILSIENPEYAICLLDAWGKRWDNPTQDNEEQFDLEKYLEKIRDIFKEDGGCSPAPEKEAEKPAVDAGVQRESFFFSRDLLAKGNDCGHLLKMLVQAQVLVVKDWNLDLNTLNTFLFGGHDLGGMLTVKKGGLGGLRTFVSVLVDRSKNKELTYSGQINSTIRKWFIQENGKPIGMTTMRGVKSDTSVYDHTIEFCKTENYWNEQGNVSGETMRKSGYRKTTLT